MNLKRSMVPKLYIFLILGIFCVVLGTIAVASPYWGSFTPPGKQIFYFSLFQSFQLSFFQLFNSIQPASFFILVQNIGSWLTYLHIASLIFIVLPTVILALRGHCEKYRKTFSLLSPLKSRITLHGAIGNINIFKT